MRNAWLLTVLIAAPVLVACGEDEDAPPPPPPPRPAGAPPPAAPAAPRAAPGPQLSPRVQIESKIVCPEIEKKSENAKECAVDAPMCDAGLYCLPVTSEGGKTYCEPCPERDTIRHDFKDRDFVADQVRDPFQSYVIVPQELVEKTEKKIEGPCNRADQFKATNYSYMDLRLVGIVSQGTQRKVLMMDRGNVGHIIRRGDCVGKEKAVVKDIGTGYVTFVVQPEDDGRTPAQPASEHSIQLHPKALDVTPSTDTAPTAPTAPIVAPPGSSTAPAGGDTPAPAPAPTK